MRSDRFYLTSEDLGDISNIAESLSNLTYLILEEADSPDQVRRYASLSEERLRELTDLINGRRGWGATFVDHQRPPS
jgi:hypothetical protein